MLFALTPTTTTTTTTVFSACIAWMAWKSRATLCIKCIDLVARAKKYLAPPFCPEICLSVQRLSLCATPHSTVPLLPCVRELRMYDADSREMDSAILKYGIMSCSVCVRHAGKTTPNDAAPRDGGDPNSHMRVCLWSLLQERWVDYVNGLNLLQRCFSGCSASHFPECIEATLNDQVLSITGQRSIVENTGLEEGVTTGTTPSSTAIVFKRGLWNNVHL